MVTDAYSKILPDISTRPVLKNGDVSKFLREQREAAGDRERDHSVYRSGSAPPTVEGALSSIGGLFDGGGGVQGLRNGSKVGFLSEEEIRSDPAYVSYYYSNAHSNPRLPPPLLSKEDWRSAQRLGGGGGGGGFNSVIGDRRKGGEGNRSLFAVQPGGFGGGVEEDGGGNGGGVDWGGDGLIGFSGSGLGSRQRSIVDMFQNNTGHSTPVSDHPSRPASRNAFESDEVRISEQLPQLRADALRSATTSIQGGAANLGSLSLHTYASALGGSLSRSTTPDPQLAARAASPRIPPIGGNRSNSMDKRGLSGSSSFNGIPSTLNDSADLGAALSSLNLSANSTVDEEIFTRSTRYDNDGHHNFFGLPGHENYAKLQAQRNSTAVANSYLKGQTTTLKGRGGSLANHQTSDLINSSLPNYGSGGYPVLPSSPSLVGNQFGSGNLPPLFENAAFATGGGLVDSKSMGSFGPNLMAAAAELQNRNRVGNHTAVDGLQLPPVDPSYLRYLASSDYIATASQLGLNDPYMDREYSNNQYLDREYSNNQYLDLLQKAYLGTLLSPEKSLGAPYVGNSGRLNHNYLGNPSFSLGMSYSGSPYGPPFLPNGPMGSGGPVRHNERGMRFATGTRNPSAWHSEVSANLDGSFPSSLLDEFKSNKAKCFELAEIASHVVEFSADQYGSRFIQQKLETATTDEKDMVFNEIMPHALSLMTDVFGNYVIQKFFEHGSTPQIRELADQLTGHVLTLSLQMYGCRVIQKAIEVVELDQKTSMVKELDGQIMRCVRDQNGNHVIQKCIECVPEEAIHFIVSTFYDQVVTLSTHPYGCRVIQRVLEHCHDERTQHIMMGEILQSVCMLAQDQYGNYVVQHVLEHGKSHERSEIIRKLTGQIVQMSQQKFASNVIEKCLTFGSPAECQNLVNEMLGTTDENEPLQAMMKDQFANYVVQKVLETCDDQQLELILNRIKVHLNALKKYTYGKHIVARVEKLVAAGERRISVLSLQPSA